MIKKKGLTQDDKKIWEDYIKDPIGIYDKDLNNSQSTSRKDRFRFDLHGYTLEEANKKVEEIILFCSNKKYKEILFITGKGIHSNSDKDIYASKNLAKLKYSVPEYIKSNQELFNLIISIEEAELKDGGGGAILVKLKNL